jgi:1-acyl-sn-glycerol-3-phosphate acyltransferase
MRAPFIFLGILFLTAVLAPVVVVAGMLGVEERANGIYQRCMHAWTRAILRISGVKLIVHNPERMSASKGHVYI